MTTTETERRASDRNRDREILDDLRSVKEMVTTINAALVGEVKEDKPGLLERVRKLEEVVGSAKKFIYSISFLLLADLVMRLWTLVVSHAP